MIGVHATTLPLPGSPAALETPRARRSVATSEATFGELLAGLKAAKPLKERGEASPLQMLKLAPVTAKDRRASERREDYEADVTQRAEALSDARRAGRETVHEQPSPNSESLSWADMDPTGRGDSIGRIKANDSAPPETRREPARNQTPAFRPPVVHESRASVVDVEPEQSTPATGSPSAPAVSLSRAEPGQASPAPANAAAEIARALTSIPSGKGDASLPLGFSTSAVEPRSGNNDSGRPDVQKAPAGAARPQPEREARTDSTVSKFEQLVRAVRATSGRQSTARVLLDPPDLGRMHVRVTVAGDRVEIGVETENETARELIVGRAQKLKSVLEQHGLAIERFEISTHRGALFEPRLLQPPSALPEGRSQKTVRTRKADEDGRMSARESVIPRWESPSNRSGMSFEVEC